MDESLAVEIVNHQILQGKQGGRIVDHAVDGQIDRPRVSPPQGRVNGFHGGGDVQRIAALAGKHSQSLQIIARRAGLAVITQPHIMQKGGQRFLLIIGQERNIARQSLFIAQHIIQKTAPKATIGLAGGQGISQHRRAADPPAQLIGMKHDRMIAVDIAVIHLNRLGISLFPARHRIVLAKAADIDPAGRDADRKLLLALTEQDQFIKQQRAGRQNHQKRQDEEDGQTPSAAARIQACAHFGLRPRPSKAMSIAFLWKGCISGS